ncbi:MAG: sigma-70 family RNA polymerase sigma factor [Planctomycetota bacterium]|nr:sigma-70 family RNA polymerase sigma factor [Planctomycetota bacterium]
MDETDVQNALIESHAASFAWAMVCCRDRELAEEVLQSVYVKVLDRRAPYQGSSSFRTWLFAVIRNAAVDHQRKRWWSRVLRLEFEALAELADSTHDDKPQVDEEDERSIVRAALGKLPARQRQVAHLVFYENLTVADAANVMDVTVGTARQHYARAKESLKVLLNPLRKQTDESIIR